MLEQVHDALWVAEGEIVSFFGFPYPTRSVIARLDERRSVGMVASQANRRSAQRSG